MNIAGALSIAIFLLTVLTVVAALLSYLIFKSRERSRKKTATAQAAGVKLLYFVEYTLPGMEEQSDQSTEVAVIPAPAGKAVLKYLIGTAALMVVVAGGWTGYYLYRGRSAAPVKRSPRLAALVATKTPVETKVPGEAKATRTPPARPAPPNLGMPGRRAASLFPVQKLDLNRDGAVQPDERVKLHKQIPQFIFVTSDDNGSVQGLKWMKQEFSRRGFWGKVTFFMTGNYLSGRKNYLGGDIDGWWQTLLDESYIGLHGTTHAPGADTWDQKRWDEELSTVQGEICRRLKLPGSWTWDGYPWGTRAPFLMLTDAYFQALARLKPKVVFDSSLVVHPGGPIMAPPREGTPRDLPWPFTLNTPLPATLDPPYLPSAKARARIASHDMWEVPIYAWYLHPPEEKPSWQPSMDSNLWKLYGCQGDQPNNTIVDELMDNLKAHYEGNRAPFHIGLHANNYNSAETCKRKTLAALLTMVEAFKSTHARVQYISIPELIAWLEERGRL